jgi:hypothetical protein
MQSRKQHKSNLRVVESLLEAPTSWCADLRDRSVWRASLIFLSTYLHNQKTLIKKSNANNDIHNLTHRILRKMKKGKVGSILTFSSHVYVSQEVQNQKHLFQFAQVLHTAPCHQFSKKIPLS